MLDHIGFPVSDFAASREFYTRVLATLGYSLVLEVDAETTGTGPHAGFGRPGRPQFWITEGEPITGRLHVAFMARDQAAVDDFYKPRPSQPAARWPRRSAGSRPPSSSRARP